MMTTLRGLRAGLRRAFPPASRNRFPWDSQLCAAFCGVVTVAFLLASTALSADPQAWRSPVPDAPAWVLVKGATIWTSGPEGTLENADLLVADGKVRRLGQNLEAPAGAHVIDARGLHVTPGLLDAHSHIAVEGSVNETSRTLSPEVRIGDVVDSEDVTIYRQLAGGTTTSNLLHGSANAIGGQNAIIKLRWGLLPEGLAFQGAPAGIKFALGENPKKSNSRRPRPNHFPSTRQGIETQIEERLLAAKNYQRQWQEYRQGSAPAGVPKPRVDLHLEALVEILEGKRQVHSHSYRADEILMLLALAERHGFRIATFQHVLEGYKVADEIAAHGAGASTFSDWWSFKFEVIDAIPYNAALMTERGVLVSLNSDSGELGRRMNLEAAKAVRYGNMAPAEALKLVTLNPAKQLGIDHRVGSLEAGKDADFVLWSGPPLSTQSLCLQTWIDGRPYFDRQRDAKDRQNSEAERQALIAKVRALESADKAGAKP